MGYRMLGDYYFSNGELDKATAEYESLYSDHPKDLQVKKNFIQLLILKNRLDEARKLNEEILKTSPNDTEGLIYRGQIHIRDKHPNDAVHDLQSALKNDPDNGAAHYQLGVAFDALGNLGQAESEWRDAVRLRPDLAEGYRALAVIALRKGQWDSLEQSAARMIALQPNVAEGYAMRAVS
ncbi:MAG: hypothetical protein DMG90_02875 [Acidobacteria bacterium]|nr:MAG: hypothetical protein DMG90_02875 [Acidobacteriota bacterium]